MRVALGPLLGVFNDSAITVVVYLATPGKESPSLSDEATEVRYFAPDEIPWHDLAFPTTTDAVTAWVALARKKIHVIERCNLRGEVRASTLIPRRPVTLHPAKCEVTAICAEAVVRSHSRSDNARETRTNDT